MVITWLFLLLVMELNPEPTTRPHFDLLRLHHNQPRKWFENTTFQEMETFQKHHFGVVDRKLCRQGRAYQLGFPIRIDQFMPNDGKIFLTSGSSYIRIPTSRLL